MGRRGQSEAQREARKRLKERQTAEVAGFDEFFEIEARREALAVELDALDGCEAKAIRALSQVTSPAAIADVIGWSVTKVRSVARLASSEEDERPEAVETAAAALW